MKLLKALSFTKKVGLVAAALTLVISGSAFADIFANAEYRINANIDGQRRALGYFGNANGGDNINFVKNLGLRFVFEEVEGKDGIFTIRAKENTNRKYCLAAYKDTSVNRNPLILSDCGTNTNTYDRTLLWKVEENGNGGIRLISYYRSYVKNQDVERFVVANQRSMENIKLKSELDDGDVVDFNLDD